MPAQQVFNPYSHSGGTILAIAGADFSVVAGDIAQHSHGSSIETRCPPKVFRLTDRGVLAVNGFAADGNMFVKTVKQRLEWYRHAHAADMPLRAIAGVIQAMLYGRRNFPFYVSNILGGIEADGTGAVYSFDTVGSYERQAWRVAGTAQTVLQPYLDKQLPPANSLNRPQLQLGAVIGIVIDAFTGAAKQRHIKVGDSLEIYVILAKGRPTHGLERFGAGGSVSEITVPGGEGERVFVVMGDLKRD